MPTLCSESYLVWNLSEVELAVEERRHFKEKRRRAFRIGIWRHKWMGRGKACRGRKGSMWKSGRVKIETESCTPKQPRAIPFKSPSSCLLWERAQVVGTSINLSAWRTHEQGGEVPEEGSHQEEPDTAHVNVRGATLHSAH